ncbi:unnamed protein product [Protopolystoma xenopodis]|uniref:Uncharacterized protein n=1 Tax=Protopolystoma xenopodis TaxID=117903 RepID=A0A448WTJ5_9PLAT|nr:unnamed protein product [Protopolystoma xenopodis]
MEGLRDEPTFMLFVVMSLKGTHNSAWRFYSKSYFQSHVMFDELALAPGHRNYWTNDRPVRDRHSREA